MSRNNEAFGDEDDLANEEYERQRRHEEQCADDWKDFRE